MFAKYLMILFVPPLYLLLRKQWLAGSINLLFYIGAIVTLPIFFFGILPWALCTTQGFFEMRKEMMKEQAEAIATAMHQDQQS